MQKKGMSRAEALEAKDMLGQALERLPDEAVVITASVGSLVAGRSEVYIRLASGLAQAAAAYGDPPVRTIEFVSSYFSADGVCIVQSMNEDGQPV